MKLRTTLFCIASILFSIAMVDAVQAQHSEDLKYRRWRVTLFPPLSTNGLEAPNYTARYSINIIGGYHGGVDGIEIGGLFNYNKYYSNGFQIAGGLNLSGGGMSGINIAGLANISKQDMSGLQFAGLINTSGQSLQGIQGAGILNVANGASDGLQFAGLGNVSTSSLSGLQGAGIFNASLKSISGLQFAGIGNVAAEDVSGLQVSGVFNFAGNSLSGLQFSGASNIALENIEGLMVSGGVNVAGKRGSGLLVAGGVNIARNQEGFLMAGGANISEKMEGLQMAGFLNASKNATGVQIGTFNFAQTFEGAPVGLVSLYGNGRKNFDVRFTDGGFTDFAFTTGTYRVYNMLYLGTNVMLDREVYRVGWGIGLERNIKDIFPRANNSTLFVNQEFNVAHHFEGDWDKTLNLIYSFKYLFGKRFGSGVSVYGGPTLNMQVSRVNGADDYTWYSAWSPSAKGRQYNFWIGFTAGFRLFKQKELPSIDSYNSYFQHQEFDDWKIDW